MALSIVTSVGIMLSLPFIPPQWLWRFLLMEFIPISLILSYALSRIKRRDLAFLFASVCLSLFAAQTFETILNIHPTISPQGYLDLKEMKEKIPEDSVVVAFGGVAYWVQFIDEVDVSWRPSSNLWQSYSHVLGLFYKNRAPPFVKKVLMGAFIKRHFVKIIDKGE